MHDNAGNVKGMSWDSTWLLLLCFLSGEFYSRSGVCLSIHLTDEAVPGWEYSVAIFHMLNFTTFMFIFLAYGYIYNFIKESSKLAGGGQRKRELTVARKMTLIVVTDFLCWVPINIMGKIFSTLIR